jgi:hypothetical protein
MARTAEADEEEVGVEAVNRRSAIRVMVATAISRE